MKNTDAEINYSSPTLSHILPQRETERALFQVDESLLNQTVEYPQYETAADFNFSYFHAN